MKDKKARSDEKNAQNANSDKLNSQVVASEQDGLISTSNANSNACPPGSCFKRGDKVCVVGLQSRPELNGQTGRVVGWVTNKER